MKPCDIETTGLDFNRDKILGVALGNRFQDARQGKLADPGKGPLSFHNGKFDAKFLRRAGFDPDYAFDTMLAASILIDRPDRLTLDSCAAHYLGMPSWKDMVGNKKKMADVDPEVLKVYAEKDVAVTGQLTVELRKRLESENLAGFYDNRLHPAARMLCEVEYRGMGFDVAGGRARLEDLQRTLVESAHRLNTWAGRELNWNSPKQVIALLKEKGFNPVHYDYKKKARVESSGSECLEQFKHVPEIAALLKHREQVKLMGYLEGWLEVQYEGRIYPTYNMASTRTGRLSCSEPNLQQVPRDKAIRSLFIPSAGKVFVIADYAQIEPRVVAHYSGDEALLDVFKTGLDFYGSLATRVLGADCHPNKVKEIYPKTRQVAKVIGLSILYGIGAQKLVDFIKAETGAVFTYEDGRRLIEDYYKAYPQLRDFANYIRTLVYNGKILTTHYGRKFKMDPERVHSQGVNTIVQSTASDACLFSQLKFAAHPHAKLVAIVHDEIIYEIDPQHARQFGEELKKEMCAQGFQCPLDLEYAIGTSWGDKK